jgi:hypothetical protein
LFPVFDSIVHQLQETSSSRCVGAVKGAYVDHLLMSARIVVAVRDQVLHACRRRLARSIGGPIGWRFLVAMVTRLRASYESRLVVSFAFPQVLPILAKGKEADEGEKSEGQDGEAGIGGGRIDHAEGDGGDSEACGQGHEPPACGSYH